MHSQLHICLHVAWEPYSPGSKGGVTDRLASSCFRGDCCRESRVASPCSQQTAWTTNYFVDGPASGTVRRLDARVYACMVWPKIDVMLSFSLSKSKIANTPYVWSKWILHIV